LDLEESLDMAGRKKQSTEAAVREIRRRTRRKFSPEEKIRIVLEGLRGEQSVADLCRREGIASNLYYRWSKDFLEAGKKWHAQERGRPPSAADGQIAAIASVNDLTVVTANVKDFRRFKDLVVEDWSS
jgi:transposase